MTTRYKCTECNEPFTRFKHLKKHMKETAHLSAICKECGEVLITTREISIHTKDSGHEEFEQIDISNNLREIQGLTRIDNDGHSDQNVESEEPQNEEYLIISIDAQNTINGKNNDIVTLIHILKQLNLFAEKVGYLPKIETVIPGWMVKNGKYDYREKLEPLTRLIKIFVDKKDSELDDYLVVATTIANEGYYLSNDKKMHTHVGKSDDWRDSHRIGFRTNKKTNQVYISFPEGELAEKYDLLYSKGEMHIDLDDWEATIRDQTISKAKNPSGAPAKYFCPDCQLKFPKLSELNSHRSETGHATVKCNECSEILLSEKKLLQHHIDTGHNDFSGKIIKTSEMRIRSQDTEEILDYMDKRIEQIEKNIVNEQTQSTRTQKWEEMLDLEIEEWNFAKNSFLTKRSMKMYLPNYKKGVATSKDPKKSKAMLYVSGIEGLLQLDSNELMERERRLVRSILATFYNKHGGPNFNLQEDTISARDLRSAMAEADCFCGPDLLAKSPILTDISEGRKRKFRLNREWRFMKMNRSNID